jgi:hypothetical protein
VKSGARIIPLMLAVGCAMCTISAAVPAFALFPELRVEPHRLRITESFHGRTIVVSAEIPKGAQAVLELKGLDREEHLLRKGRRWGLWMSIGEVKVEDAPSLYLVTTTDPKLLSKEESAERWGYGALRERVKFSGSLPKPGEDDLFEQFVKLKESEGLYGEFPGGFKAVATQGRFERLQGHLKLPGNVRPENYELTLSVVKDGRVIERRSLAFPVVMRQVTAFLASLAQQRPTLYGFLAVFIAMVTGLLMGFLFRSRGAH